MQENWNRTLLKQVFVLFVILYFIERAIGNISFNAIAFTPLVEISIANFTLIYAIQLAIIALFAFIAGFVAPVRDGVLSLSP